MPSPCMLEERQKSGEDAKPGCEPQDPRCCTVIRAREGGGFVKAGGSVGVCAGLFSVPERWGKNASIRAGFVKFGKSALRIPSNR